MAVSRFSLALTSLFYRILKSDCSNRRRCTGWIRPVP